MSRYLIVMVLVIGLSGPALALEPPAQALSGPGGSRAMHAAMTKSFHGQGAQAYWLFEPDDPQPFSAPVVVFSHGIGATDPATYAAWIRHLVGRGLVVVYPLYQEGLPFKIRELTLNAAAAVRAALLELETPGHVRPELEHLALVGHSAGGQISANLAALAGELGLPQPRAVMCVQPGRSWPKPRRPVFALEDLSAIAPGTLLLGVACEDDDVTGAIDARRIVFESTAVSPADRNLVIAHSERRGGHWLKADHAAPEAPEMAGGRRLPVRRGWLGFFRGKATVCWLDALDYYCFWKLFDALCDAAFYGINREYALGDTLEQRFMGLWSDGRPVRTLSVETVPTESGPD